MKIKPVILMFFAALLLVTSSSLTGCATTGTEQATKTANSMQNVEFDYRQVSLQVDATNASLRDLTNPDQIDLKKALDTYKTEVTKMQKLGKQLDKHTADMSAQGEHYFSEWDKQGNTYTNPEIRQLSEERRLQLRDIFAKIPETSIGVKGSLHSYLADIMDILKYLSTDLTPKGVEGVTPVAQKAMQDGEELKTSVKPVLAAIDRARTAMAQGGANSGATTGGEQPGDSRKDVPQPKDQ